MGERGRVDVAQDVVGLRVVEIRRPEPDRSWACLNSPARLPQGQVLFVSNAQPEVIEILPVLELENGRELAIVVEAGEEVGDADVAPSKDGGNATTLVLPDSGP